LINQIEHNEVKSSQISENEVVGSKDSSGTIIQESLRLRGRYTYCYNNMFMLLPSTCLIYQASTQVVSIRTNVKRLAAHQTNKAAIQANGVTDLSSSQRLNTHNQYKIDQK